MSEKKAESLVKRYTSPSKASKPDNGNNARLHPSRPRVLGRSRPLSGERGAGRQLHSPSLILIDDAANSADNPTASFAPPGSLAESATFITPADSAAPSRLQTL